MIEQEPLRDFNSACLLEVFAWLLYGEFCICKVTVLGVAHGNSTGMERTSNPSCSDLVSGTPCVLCVTTGDAATWFK